MNENRTASGVGRSRRRRPHAERGGFRRHVVVEDGSGLCWVFLLHQIGDEAAEASDGARGGEDEVENLQRRLLADRQQHPSGVVLQRRRLLRRWNPVDGRFHWFRQANVGAVRLLLLGLHFWSRNDCILSNFPLLKCLYFYYSIVYSTVLLHKRGSRPRLNVQEIFFFFFLFFSFFFLSVISLIYAMLLSSFSL